LAILCYATLDEDIIELKKPMDLLLQERIDMNMNHKIPKQICVCMEVFIWNQMEKFNKKCLVTFVFARVLLRSQGGRFQSA
jgi:hypothetical protein